MWRRRDSAKSNNSNNNHTGHPELMDVGLVRQYLLDLCYPATQARSITRLCALARAEENRHALVHQHAIVGPVLLVANEAQGETLSRACETLHWLALETENIEVMVRENGVVGPLLNVISRGKSTNDAFVFACSTLNSFCATASVRDSLVHNHNVVPTLVQVASTTNSAQLYSLASLHWLSHSPRNTPSLLSNGVADLAVSVMNSEVGSLRDQALSILASLSIYSESVYTQGNSSSADTNTVRSELIKRGAVEPLVRLQSTEDNMGTVATVTLANIIGRDPKASSVINPQRLVQLLAAAVTNTPLFDLRWPTKVPTCAIRNLSVCDTHKVVLGARPVVANLARVLREQSEISHNNRFSEAAAYAVISLLELSFAVAEDSALRTLWLDEAVDPALPKILRAFAVSPVSTTKNLPPPVQELFHEAQYAASFLLYRLTGQQQLSQDSLGACSSSDSHPPAINGNQKGIFISSDNLHTQHAEALGVSLKGLGFEVWDEQSRKMSSVLESVDTLLAQARHCVAAVLCTSTIYKQSTLCRFVATLLASSTRVIVVNTDERSAVDGWLEPILGTSVWLPAWDATRMPATASAIAQQFETPKSNAKTKPLRELTVLDVSNLLRSLELTRYVDVFANNCVDGETIAECQTEDEVQSLGVDLKPQARKLLKHFRSLDEEGVPLSLLGDSTA